MPEALWTSKAIAAATQGNPSGKSFSATGISIDSRDITPGDLFVALAGARDGHEFVPAAMEKGAAGALVARPIGGACVVVDDTLKALEAMGATARDRSKARRCAVTGSVGKTGVTQAVMAGLTRAGRAHSSVRSYNNHIGVPLTLARMPKATQRAVFEIGMNHAGEIEPLSKMVRPHAVAVTTVGPVHIENFPDGEKGVARAKAEIFAGIEPGGTAVLNADNVWFDLLNAEARKAGAKVASFGTGEACDARLVAFEQAPSGPSGHLPQGGRIMGAGAPPLGELSAKQTEGAIVRAVIRDRPVEFPILQSGLHWGLNSLCALLLLQAMDVDLETGMAALGDFQPLAGRGAEKTVHAKGGDFTLVDESYNANPISMAAALKSLGVRPADGRRIVVLTDMLELGPEAPAFHAALAEPIEAAGVDLVFCAGPQMKSLWDALPPTRRGAYAEDAAALSPQVATAVESGDVVMVKGSNGSKAGVIAAALAALDDAGAGG